MTTNNFHKLLTYDKESGLLAWRFARGNRAAGKEAGHIARDGYRRVRVDGGIFLSHRVVWEMNFGKIPPGMEVDHINHDKTDNRLQNLRMVSHQVNMENKPKYRSNSSGLTGVSFHKRHNVWQSRINVDGRTRTVYTGDSLFEAACRRISAEVAYGFHANHGK